MANIYTLKAGNLLCQYAEISEINSPDFTIAPNSSKRAKNLYDILQTHKTLQAYKASTTSLFLPDPRLIPELSRSLYRLTEDLNNKLDDAAQQIEVLENNKVKILFILSLYSDAKSAFQKLHEEKSEGNPITEKAISLLQDELRTIIACHKSHIRKLERGLKAANICIESLSYMLANTMGENMQYMSLIDDEIDLEKDLEKKKGKELQETEKELLITEGKMKTIKILHNKKVKEINKEIEENNQKIIDKKILVGTYMHNNRRLKDALKDRSKKTAAMLAENEKRQDSLFLEINRLQKEIQHHGCHN